MTMVMGHPLICGPMALSAGCGLYASYDVGSGGGGLACAVLLGGIGKAYQDAQAYRQWAKSWAAINEHGRPRRPLRMGHLAALVGLIGLAAAYVVRPKMLNAVAPALATLAATCFAGIVVVKLVRWTIRRLRRRGPAPSFAVAMIAHAAGPVPTVETAYRSLPPHCAVILRQAR